MGLYEDAIAAITKKEAEEQERKEREYQRQRERSEKELTEATWYALGREREVKTEWRNVDGVEKCFAQVDGLLFTHRKGISTSYLAYVRRCPGCGCLLQSDPIHSIEELGRWLTDWPAYHPCENNQQFNVSELGLKANGEPKEE